MKNSELGLATLRSLEALGVKTVCVCPGARNSPWIALLDLPNGFERLSFFDERSAGFFALSRARSTGAPVAVITTSGTAVGELLPAMMEAYYTGARLLVMSADRPKRFRGTGSPQACEQAQIFGVYARSSMDLDSDSAWPGDVHTPLWPSHWNVCFEDPLQKQESGDLKRSRADAKIYDAQFPLVLLGELTREEAHLVLPVIQRLGFPVIAETLSHLREAHGIEPFRIRSHRDLWKEAHHAGYPIDGIYRIGGVPTLRFWRDLEIDPEASQIPVLSVSSLEFSGLPRSGLCDLKAWVTSDALPPHLSSQGFERVKSWRTAQDLRFQKLEDALSRYRSSEGAWVRELSEFIPKGSEIYLGNSLPIREWDLCATMRDRQFSFRANRGLNGIDGQISSFFGGLKKGRENFGIFGDLTALYDSNAPWIVSQMDPEIQWRIVILNNAGGQIFRRMFNSPHYLNAHQLHFESWAKQWSLEYAQVQKPEQLYKIDPSVRVLEILPSQSESDGFWNHWEPTPG
jgi:2-succinyl-5-enolpyruvyl-6-hydroxy-3-cyclohexene-1-carboxylate synthase